MPINEALVTLERFAYSPMGTFGLLSVDGGVPFRTVEQAWARNLEGISCIPCGVYRLKPCVFFGGDGVGGRRDYPAYEILGVHGRDDIKIHVANTAVQLRGCVALGLKLGVLHDVWAVLNSQKAHDLFMERMDEREGYLHVTNYVGGML